VKKLLDRYGNLVTTVLNKRGRILFRYTDTFERLDDLDLAEAQLAGIISEGLWCSRTNFTRADLRGADLYWAMAFESDFTEADLSRASLQGAALAGANFTRANLREAKLCRDNVGGSTDIRGAVFEGADLVGADFTGAEYDKNTVFPAGFDPGSFAMVRADEPYARLPTELCD
jgi:uncharacterized protein YjbI with pentapeptide repeats